MKDAITGKNSKRKVASSTDWSRLRRISSSEIRKAIAVDPDARATDDAFWKNAEVVWPSRKQVITIRLDADLLRWFRREPRYQTRINAVLRAYMAAHSSGK